MTSKCSIWFSIFGPHRFFPSVKSADFVYQQLKYLFEIYKSENNIFINTIINDMIRDINGRLKLGLNSWGWADECHVKGFCDG